jgi:hypothetical protein
MKSWCVLSVSAYDAGVGFIEGALVMVYEIHYERHG